MRHVVERGQLALVGCEQERSDLRAVECEIARVGEPAVA
jgi:hypothetical protein